MRNGRRLGLAATFAAASAVLSLVTPAAPVAASPVAGHAAVPCSPAAAGAATRAALARTDRVDDQPGWTEARLRRIDRRLHDALSRRLSAATPLTSRLALTIRIPVHAHVIDGERRTGPTRARVLRQVAVLNRAYGGGEAATATPTPFRFYLASYDRTENPEWHTASMFDAGDKAARRALHVGGPADLNLYFSEPVTPNASSVILGWSSVPWKARVAPRLDGVTLHSQSLPGGGLERYNRGDTAVHEVGHWLGLFHTFEGGCSARNDRVADTPAEMRPSMGCEVGRDSCAALDGLDPVRNFMDYSFDTCMNTFTPGQVSRMSDNWLAYRTP